MTSKIVRSIDYSNNQELLFSQSDIVDLFICSKKEKSLSNILGDAKNLCLKIQSVNDCNIEIYSDKKSILLSKNFKKIKTIKNTNLSYNFSKRNIINSKEKLYDKYTGNVDIVKDCVKKREEDLINEKISIQIRYNDRIYGWIDLDIQCPYSIRDLNDLNLISKLIAKEIYDREAFALLHEKISKSKRTIKKLRQEQKKYNLFMSEANHRVRNSLQMIHSMLINRIDEFKIYGDEAELTIRKISSRIMAISHIYDQLLVSGESRTIETDVYLNIIIDELIQIYGAQFPNVLVRRQVQKQKIKLSHASVIGIILIELVTNAFVHAFPNKVGQIHIILQRDAKKRHLNLIVKDDGDGNIINGYSDRNGLKLVQKLTEHIGGKFNLNNDNGTICKIAFLR
jgi:two-component sensor histidine kinase